MKYNYNAWHILPCGKLNLKTGYNRIFTNIFEDEKDRYLLIYQNDNNKYNALIADESFQKYVGTHKQLQHDQTVRDMGEAYCESLYLITPEQFEEISVKYNITSITLSVLK